MQWLKTISSSAQTSLAYITLGCLMAVWTSVWYVYLFNHPPETAGTYYWVTGFGLTGLTLVVIGLTVGQIGRSARHAETGAVVAAPPVVAPTQALPVATVVPPVVQPVPTNRMSAVAPGAPVNNNLANST